MVMAPNRDSSTAPRVRGWRHKIFSPIPLVDLSGFRSFDALFDFNAVFGDGDHFLAIALLSTVEHTHGEGAEFYNREGQYYPGPR